MDVVKPSMVERLSFTMDFRPNTIEHLGLRLYNSLPPVIAELVSNSWDGEAERVDITIPDESITEDYAVTVKDNGCGMDEDEIQNAYLEIGRDCRVELGRDRTKNKNRKLMGHKGLGKLAGFGVAKVVEVRTIKNGKAICFQMDLDAMKETRKDRKYNPTVIYDKTGSTEEPDGTEVKLLRLSRTSAINADWIRRAIARRFTVISCELPDNDSFEVYVNETEIKPRDRRLRRDCKPSWDVEQLPGGAVVKDEHGWTVSGWIGFVEESSAQDRGVDIFARGKLAEMNSVFGSKSTHIQFAGAYLIGELSADFLDDKTDNLSTARKEIDWDSEPGEALKKWGIEALKFVKNEWLATRKKEKQAKVMKVKDFKKWYDGRSSREQKVADKLINAIVDDEKIEPQSTDPLLQAIKTNIEFKAFQDLVDDMEEGGFNVESFLKLISDWKVIEAREHLKLSDGRMTIIDKLAKYMDEGALEVKQIQPLFEEHGWLINPSWTDVTGQNRYSKMLRENCKEPKGLPEEDCRIDILGYTAGGTLHVVELKRPESTLKRGYLEQIEKYRDWANANLLGSGDKTITQIRGLLIVGKMNPDKAIHEKVKRLAGSDILVQTYLDLHSQAEQTFGTIQKRLEKIAPEYSKKTRQEHAK